MCKGEYGVEGSVRTYAGKAKQPTVVCLFNTYLRRIITPLFFRSFGIPSPFVLLVEFSPPTRSLQVILTAQEHDVEHHQNADVYFETPRRKETTTRAAASML